MICRCGGSRAASLEIVLKWQGVTHRITSDERGQPLADLTHAERAHGAINNQIERGLFDPKFWQRAARNKLLWENYLAAYLERERSRAEAGAISLGTWKEKTFAARHLTWFNGRNVREIKTADLADYAALPCLRLALSPARRHFIIAVLGHVFHEAVRREDIERAPQMPVVQIPERAIDWFGPDEQALVLAHLPAVHRPIFGFLMAYGCRIGEACALCWDAVDRAQGVITLRRTITAYDGLVETTKTRRARELPIFDVFESYLASVPPGIGPAPVFRNPHAYTLERWYNGQSLRSIWRSACLAAGLPAIHLKNGTRHSAGMQLLNLQGADFELVRMLFGHSHTSTTRKYAKPGLALLKSLRDGGQLVRLSTPIVNPLSTANGDGHKNN